MAKEADPNNVLLGSGKVYLDRYTAAGVPSGNERFLGNCTEFSITPSVEEIEKKSSTDAARRLLRSDVTATSLELSITLDEFTPDNLALALFGEVGTYTQTGAAVTNEVHDDVAQGSYVRLAYRGISLVTVEPAGGGTAFALNTDYEIDAVEGRIYIVPGGGIANLADIQVDYTYATQSKSSVKGGAVSSIRALIRYVSNNPNSPESTAFVWRASIKGSGAVGFLSDNYASFQLSGKLEADEANHPGDPYYLLIKR